jgi:hypothetical protein
VHGRVVFWHTGRLMTRRELGPDPAAAHDKLDDEAALRHWANDARVFRRDWPGSMAGLTGALGFHWQDAVAGTSGKLGVPLPPVVAVAAVLPLIHLLIWLRSRWRASRAVRAAGRPAAPTRTPEPGPPKPSTASRSSVPAGPRRRL